jgi:hypothetical protein
MPGGLLDDAIRALRQMSGRSRLDEDDRAWIRALVFAVEQQVG